MTSEDCPNAKWCGMVPLGLCDAIDYKSCVAYKQFGDNGLKHEMDRQEMVEKAGCEE